MNISLGFIGEKHFYLLKYCWLLNGFVQATLWSSIIRLLNENLPKKYISLALVLLPLPVSIGTFTIYELSALISALSISFKVVFFLAGALLFVMGVFWICFIDIFKNSSRAMKEKTDERVVETKNEESVAKNQSTLPNYFLLIFSILSLLAVANNFVKDGLTTWMPTILKETYLLDNSISTFLTLFLPFFAVFGSALAFYLNKKLKNYVLVCGIFYLVTLLLFVLVLAFLKTQSWVLPLICFILVAMAMSGVNNIITSIFPMLYQSKSNAGALAGILDGFCYLGSAITAYGLGAISEKLGDWTAIFYLFICVCALMMVVCTIYYFITRKKVKEN